MCAPLLVPALVAICPVPADDAILAACAASTDAAFLHGLGHASLQAALDAAGPGDTITVCPGTWPGNVRFGEDKQLVAADPRPGITVLDGRDASWLLEIDDGTVRGLTLRNGRRLVGGAAIQATGHVLVECVVAENNHATLEESVGGAVFSSGTLVVRHSRFSDNTAQGAGGAISIEGTLDVDDSAFFGNRAGYEGAAIAVGGHEDGALVVHGSWFEGNRTRRGGGAISIGGLATETVAIEGSTFPGEGIGAVELVP